ncbi:hypothetical protein DFH06DRAFT_921773, partial [Mycena polygramma]
LTSTGRPDAVTWWIQRARKPTPAISDLPQFVAEWQGWWKSLNPEWRVSEGEMMRREDGRKWECLEAHGMNGMLSVLICLKWW